MRKIDLKEPEGEAWALWRLACEAATLKLHDACAKAEALKITDLYKSKSIRKLYFFSGGAPFYGKCAFCERPIPDLRDGDIEHFRPKAAVTDEKDNVIFLLDDEGKILVDASGKPVPHPGYYWLAYDWRNLLIACRRCNQPTEGKLGKKARFPVVGKHASSPIELVAEVPLLINPASGFPEDDPEKHLDVDLDTGALFAKDDSARGIMCINVLGLNSHTDLVLGRQRAAREVAALILQLRYSASARAELKTILDGGRPFTMAARAEMRAHKAATSPFNDRV